MGKPLATTSSTNAMAMVVYVGLAFVGAYFTIGPAHPALTELYGQYVARVAMGLVTIFTLVATAGALASDKAADPSRGLRIEAATLVPIILILGALLGSFIKVYGPVAGPTVIGFTAIFFVGFALRALQARKDYKKVEFARSVDTGEKAEVTASPEEK